MNKNGLVRQRAVWECLRWFDRTPKTEEQFRARMETLPDEELNLLRAFYGITDDRDLLAVICRFWDVRISGLNSG
jgi:hypothetical protein